MALTFLGVENPLGLFGLKQRGVLASASDVHEPVATWKGALMDDARKIDAGKSKGDRYAERVDYFASRTPEWARGGSLLSDMVQDAADNRAFVVKVFKQKYIKDLRIAMCSSLGSLLKYMVNHHKLEQKPFDTMVLYGHGGAGGMNVGLGRLSLPARPAASEDDEEAKGARRVRAMAGVDRPSETGTADRRIREVGIDNRDLWGSAFAGSKGCFTECEETGCVHLFLMACSTAEQVGGGSQRSFMSKLPEVAAQVLNHALGKSVCVAAPETTIDDEHILDLLANLGDVRAKLMTGDEVHVGKGTPVRFGSCII